MENVISHYIDEETYDISHYEIKTHAIGQYFAKCAPGLSLMDIILKMRENMKEMRKVELNKKKREDRVAFVDKEGCVFITDNDKVITVFPQERIFVAKTFYSNKKTGRGYL